MKTLPYIVAALIAIGAATTIAVLTYTAIAALYQRHLNTRRDKTERNTGWTHYSRPDNEGRWVIGVERRHGDTTYANIMMHTLHADVDDITRIDAENRAMLRAVQYNTTGARYTGKGPR